MFVQWIIEFITLYYCVLSGILCHVNLIPLNPTDKFNGKPTNLQGIESFIKILVRRSFQYH